MVPKDELGESRELASLVIQTAERLKSDFASAVQGFDFPASLARALLLIEDPITMGTLAAQLACDQSYITRLSDDLISRGLASREPGKDRRVHYLQLTNAGEEMRNKLALAVTSESVLLSKLSTTERDNLRQVLLLLLK